MSFSITLLFSLFLVESLYLYTLAISLIWIILIFPELDFSVEFIKLTIKGISDFLKIFEWELKYE